MRGNRAKVVDGWEGAVLQYYKTTVQQYFTFNYGQRKHGQIHGNPVVDGWAGAVMPKMLIILDIFPTDRNGKV